MEGECWGHRVSKSQSVYFRPSRSDELSSACEWLTLETKTTWLLSAGCIIDNWADETNPKAAVATRRVDGVVHLGEVRWQTELLRGPTGQDESVPRVRGKQHCHRVWEPTWAVIGRSAAFKHGETTIAVLLFRRLETDLLVTCKIETDSCLIAWVQILLMLDVLNNTGFHQN